jgi:CheY-like chemotaxis protein
MTGKSILLVDNSSVRKPFLSELLQEAGKVWAFVEADRAMQAVKRGLPVDVAVLQYRLSLTPLIQTLRRQLPKVRIIAYGSPRAYAPLGVDAYLRQPLLSAELQAEMEKATARQKAN